MKTTIEIPKALYTRAKIRAVERGETLRQVVLRALEREVAEEVACSGGKKNYWAKRKLRPGYQKALETGVFSVGADSADLLAEDRSSREDALF